MCVKCQTIFKVICLYFALILLHIISKAEKNKVSKDEESRRGKAKNSPLAVIFFIVYAISTTFSVFSLE